MTAAGVLLGLCVALGFGCQRGTPTEPTPVANKVAQVAEPTRAAGEPATPATTSTMTTPAPARPAVEPAHVTLPKSPSTPVKRSAKPFTRKQREWFSAFRFKDFDRQARATNDEFTEFRHTTLTRPKLAVTVRLDACKRAKRATRKAAPDPGACMPMELAPWQARSDELKQSLSPALIARPDTRFEIGERELFGMRAIYSYQLGYFFGQDDKGQPAGDYSDAYILHYNDGVNRIQVVAAYVDDPVGGKDQLVALAPPEDLERLAVAFTSFYLHRWH